MITGSVNAALEAIITIRAADASRTLHSFEAIIDTGFNGSLTLPEETVAELNLPWRSRAQVELADGTRVESDVYTCLIDWDGQPLNALVEVADTDPLVGMALMQGYELRVQVDDGGVVELTAGN